MKIKNPSTDERGIAHLGLIILVVLVIGVGVFAFMRVQSANKSDDVSNNSSQSAASDEDQAARDAAKLNSAEQEAEKVPAQANDQEVTDNVAQ